MAEEKTPFTRTCAWTGEDFEGKGYILTTTDGTEIVSAAAFLAPWQVPEDPAAAPAPAVEDTPPADPQS